MPLFQNLLIRKIKCTSLKVKLLAFRSDQFSNCRVIMNLVKSSKLGRMNSNNEKLIQTN